MGRIDLRDQERAAQGDSHAGRTAAGSDSAAWTSRLTPAVVRTGALAAALSLAISGGAYAAVIAADPGAAPISEPQARLEAIGSSSSEGDEEPGLAVEEPVQTVTTTTEDTVEAHGSVEQSTDELAEGETKVGTEGVDGVTRTTYRVTLVDGQEVSRDAVATVVVTEKVDEVVLVGTGSTSSSSDSSGTTPTTSSTAVDDGSVWARLAQCESGGNPAANTGNGYYGMYQFSLSTWRSVGGTGYPHEADAATQTAMAQALQSRSGWGQWPHCAAQLGLL